MKELKDITVLVQDFGTFLSVAEMFGRACKRCLYYSPYETEYRDAKLCCIGGGLEYVERCDRPLDPKIIKEVDLVVSPDIGFADRQMLYRSMNKSVWGSFDATNLELSRTLFLQVMKELNLPVVKSVPILGLSSLEKYLSTVKNKWVKVNRFRSNRETFKHTDMVHTIRIIEALAVDFGGIKEEIEFVVQDTIDSDLELGYDGWFITDPDGEGWFPDSCFQGYELKNELYLGSLLKYEELPEQIRMVNERFGKVLQKYGYRNFMATELRIRDKVPYFIDPTARTAGQTQEHLFTTCTNMAEVIWHGANGIVIPPKFRAKFAMEATMHYTGDCEAWKTLRVPDEIEDFVKLYHYCMVDGVYQFPTRKTDEVGVICGLGDTIQAAFGNLMLNFSKMKNEPVKIESADFAHLIKEVEEAQSQGIKFTNQPLPDPSLALSKG